MAFALTLEAEAHALLDRHLSGLALHFPALAVERHAVADNPLRGLLGVASAARP